MTTKKRKKSEAIRRLEEVTGGPLMFSDVIESTRLCDEISQAEFARMLGISRQHLCDIEKGRKTVSPARAAKWAKKLGYSEQMWAELALQAVVDAEGLGYRVKLEHASLYV